MTDRRRGVERVRADEPSRAKVRPVTVTGGTGEPSDALVAIVRELMDLGREPGRG